MVIGESAERLAAAAGALDVRVSEREPGTVEAVDVVELGAVQDGEALVVDHDRHAFEGEHGVAVGARGVEREVVLVAGAAAAAHAHAQGLVLGDVLFGADLQDH